MFPLQQLRPPSCVFFFFNDTATTEIYTLSLHDALPISYVQPELGRHKGFEYARTQNPTRFATEARSEEHTSELQSQSNLVCRLLLEKKNFSSALALKTLNRPFFSITFTWSRATPTPIVD